MFIMKLTSSSLSDAPNNRFHSCFDRIENQFGILLIQACFQYNPKKDAHGSSWTHDLPMARVQPSIRQKERQGFGDKPS